MKSLSCVRLCATPWIVAYQAPPSMGFCRQEYWSGLPFPSPGGLPNPGIVLNLGLLHCRQTLYHLSHQGSPLTRGINASKYKYPWECLGAEYAVQHHGRIWYSVEWQTQQLANGCVWTRGIFTLDFYFIAIWFKTSHFACSVVTSLMCWGFCMGVAMWGWKIKQQMGLEEVKIPVWSTGCPGVFHLQLTENWSVLYLWYPGPLFIIRLVIWDVQLREKNWICVY